MATLEERPRRDARALLIMIVSLVLYTAADLGTKEWALDNLSRTNAAAGPVCEPDAQGLRSFQRLPTPPKPFIEGVLRLNYAENCGAAFSMLRSAPGWARALVFGVASIGAAIVLSVMFVRGSGGRLFAIAVPLILSGAIGNLADRIRHGFVVDFLQVDPQLFNYPVFNVADIWIAVGVGLLLLEGGDKKKKPVEQPVTA
ncbi:MAG TPA: signal peptidase II [Polyangiales bacterium]|nr:signal peptidase II [Polyangiales bacterium]